MHKGFKLAIVVIIILSILTGCFNYEDINNVIFVTCVYIDIDDSGKPILYVEGFHSFRSNETNSEKGERIFYNTSGETLFDASRELNTVASYRLNYTQNKAIVFTEKAARYGIEEFLDILSRDQEMLLRSYLIVMKDASPEDIIKLEIKENEYIGLFLFEMLENPAIGARKIHDRLNKYLNNRLKGKQVALLTLLTLDKNPVEEKIKTAGAAILEKDKLIGYLDPGETMNYHFLMGTLKAGLIMMPHPYLEDKKVILEIIANRAKTKSEITLVGDRIILKKKISVRTTFGETQSRLILDSETLERLKTDAENKIKTETEALFNEYKELGVDLFNVQDFFNYKYPKVDVENAIKVTDIDVEVNVFIEGSTDKTNFR